MNFFLLFALSAAIVVGLVAGGVYIINEETLLALIFIAFVFLIYEMVSDLVRTELDNRTLKIEQEFDAFFAIREKSLELLLQNYNKQLTIHQNISDLVRATERLLSTSMTAKKAKLENQLAAQIKTKLEYLVQKENSILLDLQTRASAAFLEAAFKPFLTKNPTVDTLYLKRTALNEGIQLLNTYSEYKLDSKNQELKAIYVLQQLFNVPFETAFLAVTR